MTLKRTSLLVFCLFLVFYVEAEKEYSLVSAASSFLKIFSSFKSTINLISLPITENKIIDDILKKSFNDLQYAVEITNRDKIISTSYELKYCNVFFADELESFRVFLTKFPSNVYDAQGYFIVVVMKKIVIKEIRELFKLVWQIKIFNLNIIYEEEDQIFSTQLVLFSKNCAGMSINETLITTKLTKDTSFNFANKLNDLKGCPVKVSTFVLSPFVMKKDSGLIGRDVELMKTLSQALQFRLDFDVLEGDVPWGYLYDNGTGTGAIAKLMNNETDIILGDFFLKLSRLKFLDSSDPYFSSQLIFVIPPPGRLSSFQKLSQPFQLNVWISLIICYLVGALFILSINRRSDKLKIFVFGSVDTTPMTNMLSITLGLSQPVTPKGTLPRYLFTLFIMFSLVMRTLYQGSLYQFLQSDEVRESVKSYDDMLEKNLKVYIDKSLEDLIHNQSELNQRKSVIYGNLSQVFKLFNDPKFKGVLIAPLPNILMMNQRQNYNFSFNVLKHEVFATLSVVMYFQKRFYLAPAINDALQKIQSAGLIEYWHNSYYTKKNIKTSPEKRLKLSNSHLLGAYEVWAGGCILSLAVFTFEKVIEGLKNNIKLTE